MGWVSVNDVQNIVQDHFQCCPLIITDACPFSNLNCNKVMNTQLYNIGNKNPNPYP